MSVTLNFNEIGTDVLREIIRSREIGGSVYDCYYRSSSSFLYIDRVYRQFSQFLHFSFATKESRFDLKKRKSGKEGGR